MIFGAILSALFLACLWAIAIVLALPKWIAALVSLFVVFGWLALVAVRLAKAKGAAREIEKSLGQQAEAQAGAARPDQQLEIQAMQAEFQKAVRALKGSRLGRGGSNALAVLPWYLIIGPPGAGKSTALRASGLKFPYLSARGGGVKGVGGTRNCEWWLTNDAVILDTAGRYATEDDDHDEWLSFLETLQRTRPAKPVNGLIVAVSLADLGGETEEGAIEMAQKLRERVDEVMSRLRLVLPVYLLLTKADLLPGFVEIFGSLRKTERNRIWGFTLPVGEAKDHAEVVGERFDELAACADERMLARVAEERQLLARGSIYQFPQQLEALRPNLLTLVENLFAENAYQDTPVLRGVYFTSGTQEGRTIDRVTGAMAEAFGIRPSLSPVTPVLETKSYFLRDVFAKVIFPDRDLAMRNARERRRQAIRRAVLATACAVLALGVLYFPLRSYMLNRALLFSTLAAVEDVKGSAPRGRVPLATLDPVRLRLEELLRAEAGRPPLALRFGLYQGAELVAPLRRFFAAWSRSLFFDAALRQDTGELEAFTAAYESSGRVPELADHARAYALLKTHLLLTAPRGPLEPRLGPDEESWLDAQVAERWAGQGPEAASILADSAFYVKLLAEEPALALPRQEDLVRRARKVLQRVPPAQLALNKVLGDVGGREHDLGLDDVLGMTVTVLKSDARVRGAFTRKGYERAKEQLENAAKLLEPWVLEPDATDTAAAQAQQAAQVRSLYFQRYIDEWKAFIDSISVVDLPPLSMLQELARGESPPLRRLFHGVRYHTALGGKSAEIKAAAQGRVESVRKWFGEGTDGAPQQPKAREEEGRLEAGNVERAFQGFVEFGVSTETPLVQAAAAAVGGSGGGAQPQPRTLPLEEYEAQLVGLRDALQSARESTDAAAVVQKAQGARTIVRALIDRQDLRWRSRFESLLWPPIEAASRGSVRVAASGAGLKWCSAVAQPFRHAIASRYPFRTSGEPAALADVAEFFRPNSGTVWAFYNEALRNDIQRTGDGFRFARSMGGVSGFRPEVLTFLQKAQQITNVLFPGGASAPSVQLDARIRPAPRVAVVWFEVDGQSFVYRNGPEESHRVAWPGQGKTPGASLRVRAENGAEETLREDGEWGFLRLLEDGQSTSRPNGRDFSVSWTLPGLGVTVPIDFIGTRSETPFFTAGRRPSGHPRLLAPLRNGIAAPRAIARGGPGCDTTGKP